MILYPNCKLNIGLRVVRKRPDGYHDLETIFYPVYGLHDELEVTLASNRPLERRDCQFEQEGIVVDCAAEDNLILKCHRLFANEFEQIGSVDIRFVKNIPFGAGLGGGSSDAAHMAIALNELFDLGLTKQELAQRVSRLGADCAFFIYNTPCWAEGIGDQLREIDFDLTGKRLVMIKPNVGVSTRDAYSGITPRGTGLAPGGINAQDAASLRMLTNDFEETVFKKYPTLSAIKQRLIDAGAVYAAMSGSGSTIFGLFENNPEGRTMAGLRGLYEDFASMIIFDDTL